MVSAGISGSGLTARNLREPEFQTESGVVRMQRQVRVGAALAPRSLPTGVHGPFSLAFDADLTTTTGAVRESAGEWQSAGSTGWREGLVGARAGFDGTRQATRDPCVLGRYNGQVAVVLLYVEGHMTKADESDETVWSIGGQSNILGQ